MTDPTGVEAVPAYAATIEEVLDRLGSDSEHGLSQAEVAQRVATYGRNEIATEKPPSIVAVALGQLRDPMNLMLVAVTLVSLVIGEISTGVIVGLLIVLNVVLGSRQELKARASVDALAKLQVPQARVVRDGQLQNRLGDRHRAGRRGRGRGRGHPARRRPDPAIGHPGDAGGCVDRGERAHRQGRQGHRRRSTSGWATRRTCCSRTPPSPEAPELWWSRRPGCRPRWVRSPPCSPRWCGPGPRSSASSTR